ncbi:MAG TPA: LLM class flavin-dependent oxidoreductase [Baekduia sp.]
MPGTTRDELLSWARRAEECGFSSLSVVDRLVYGNWEPLIALAAAAAVTERIRLTATILIVPARGNPALLAKQVATVQELSGGRLSLGVGLGGRPDDYIAAGVDAEARGRLMDDALAELEQIWGGARRGLAGAIGPTPSPVPPLSLGGFSPAAYRRAARHGEGWVAAGGGPDAFRAGAVQAAAAWRAAGRTDRPRLSMIAYFGLGPDAEERATAALLDYYAFAGGPEHVLSGDALAHVDPALIARTALTSEAAVLGARDAFAGAGCDELILLPTQAGLDQVELLAAAGCVAEA